MGSSAQFFPFLVGATGSDFPSAFRPCVLPSLLHFLLSGCDAG